MSYKMWSIESIRVICLGKIDPMNLTSSKPKKVIYETRGWQSCKSCTYSELVNPDFKNNNIDFPSLNDRLEPLRNRSRRLLLDSLNKEG